MGTPLDDRMLKVSWGQWGHLVLPTLGNHAGQVEPDPYFGHTQ